MKRNEGFTLIELMIVVAIIAIIAAIAIPSLLNARKAGNEASAISSLRTLTTVNEQYRTRFQQYPDAMASLQAEDYIDDVLAAGQKSGYDFTYVLGAEPTAEWECNADPISDTVTGDRWFYVDQSGVIRFGVGAQATDTDPPIDG